MNKTMKLSAILNVIAIVLLVLLALSVIASAFFRIRLSSVTNERYEMTYSANRFMNASSYLTSEVRAFSATGLQEHYDNYWNEVNVLKNREHGVGRLREIGITEHENNMITEMARLSDELVPVEEEAMRLVMGGDTTGALDIVYGTYYNTTVARINALRNEFIVTLNARIAKRTDRIDMLYSVINIISWFMVLATVLIQLLQKHELFQLAYIDPLTGGDNYNAFREKMYLGKGVGGAGYVVSVDLKGFSSINDTCGVAKGDEVIHRIGVTLASHTRKGELSAHISGDRFVLFVHSPSIDTLLRRITDMRHSIMAISKVLDVPHIVPVFGIRDVENTHQPENSYSDANLAMQQMKSRADAFYAIFNADTRKRILETQQMEDNFEAALRERQFVMCYQPKCAPSTKMLVAAEALVRWRNADGSMVSPGKFIPLFERNGMIAQLDEYTFERVCAQQKAWLDEGLSIVPISVNVSRASLYYTDIVDRYMSIVEHHKISTEFIELEITESAMEGNENIEELMRKFRSHGFRILVDDFGSGYSSLYTLTKNYFDNIKIDKSLVDCISTPEGDSLLESIVHMAHGFNMTVTAEGVEQEHQVEFLTASDFDSVQGYYYSRPLPSEDFRKLLHTRKVGVR